MGDYIEREKIQKRLSRIVEVNNLRTDRAWFTPYGVNALIEEIPAADVRPVKRGKWVEETFFTKPVCSVCGISCIGLHGFDYKKTQFCPNCGADMRPDDERA